MGMIDAIPPSWRHTAIACALLLLSFSVFYRVSSCEFVHYDDPDYITGNPYVQAGLKADGIKWAFLTLHGPRTYWHPITWLSHMVDVQLFGMHPRGHHLVNALLHSINAVLLFSLLFQLTKALWRSGMVAALFAIHPLQVDTVAWVSERKNILAGLFFLLTLLAYCRYARKPRLRGYLVVLSLFGIGLMCKPSIVTLPLVLLLVDWWPLNRLQPLISFANQSKGGRQILAKSTPFLFEKLPLFAFSAISASITITGHQQIGIFEHNRAISFGLRLENALISYCRYLKNTFWPSDLAVLYPYETDWPIVFVSLASILLLAVTLFTLARAKHQPYLLFGWAWFLIILLPTIGLVQAGIQAMADRFMYLPIIGLFVGVVWQATEWSSRLQRASLLRVLLAASAILVLGTCSWRQIGFWQNDLTLWSRAVGVTKGNYLGHYDLALTLYLRGDLNGTMAHLQEALRLKPDYSEARCLTANVFYDRGQTNEAIVNYLETERLNPSRSDVPFHLARIFHGQNKVGDAVDQYRKVLAIDPDSVAALNNLAWILASTPDPSLRNGRDALAFAIRACELTDSNAPIVLGTLAAAYAENGQFDRATRLAKRARQLALEQGQKDVAAKNERLLEFYQSRKPAREP